MPSIELVDLTALVLRYDFTVWSFVPSSKVRLSFACSGCGGSMLFTIWVTIEPSFLSSFWGRDVLMVSGTLGSSRSRRAAPSCLLNGTRTTSSSG